MTTTPRSIRDLDVPLETVQALVARQKVQARTERLREILAHPEIAEKPGTRGELAEYRHLLLDADPDSTTRQFVDLAKGKPWRAL
ncbi:hypothetical protein OG819_42965 [Streptomyces sp. NBC_01549]|uniref:hypothetical protein n=1 Tax=Streptomyces sp. NBC_01549 TaxID=2975874 RepID=UPI0022594E31|nr:hypothetical protein [Streptomyces sp. NBC_01549]MCX4596180.1 hypothetical protein [Streptomyces sp. NBC_01549]